LRDGAPWPILLRMSVDRIEVPVESTTVRAPDGLDIRVHKVGSGPHRWLLPPGMGTPLLCWKHILEAFAEKMTVVTWDQRGTYDSGSPMRSDLTMDHHVADGLAVLESLDWGDEPFVTGSWSMGVQIGLEIYRRMPERICGLVFINGAYEHPLKTAYGPEITRPVLRALLRRMVRASDNVQLHSTVRNLFTAGVAGDIFWHLRVARANRPFFVQVTKELGRLDFGNYLQILLSADDHSARDVLNDIRIPTLITAGTKDMATPASLAKETLGLVPWSDFVKIEGGTHYTPLEFPDQLNAALQRFFAYRVFPDSWDDTRKRPKGARVKRRRTKKKKD
jgi:pimeloyl-ACP methyl ester carboxylesterase